MKTLYFDCSAGAAGDMLLASMMDLGLSEETLKTQLKKLPLEGYNIHFNRVQKQGIGALQISIEVYGQQPHRHLAEIEAVIKGAAYSETVQEKSLAVFQALARAEARVHDMPPDCIHFHEVGAVDSILDIVGCMIALEQLGVDQVFSSPLPLGKGWVKTAHGLIPLPAPATAEVIKDYSIPCYGVQVDGETVTPTGAAILAVICSRFSPLPPGRLEAIGYGGGQKDYDYPNLVRSFLGSFSPAPKATTGVDDLFLTEPVDVIEANIDDLNPEIFEHVLNCLLEAGAMDVFLTPIQMKKNRPAIKLTVLARPVNSHKLGHIVLRETTTLGYRRNPAEKIMLPREHRLVNTPWGDVRVKMAGRPPNYLNAAPEYQDCLEIAQKNNVPLKDVYQAVWRNLDDTRS